MQNTSGLIYKNVFRVMDGNITNFTLMHPELARFLLSSGDGFTQTGINCEIMLLSKYKKQWVYKQIFRNVTIKSHPCTTTFPWSYSLKENLLTSYGSVRHKVPFGCTAFEKSPALKFSTCSSSSSREWSPLIKRSEYLLLSSSQPHYLLSPWLCLSIVPLTTSCCITRYQ